MLCVATVTDTVGGTPDGGEAMPFGPVLRPMEIAGDQRHASGEQEATERIRKQEATDVVREEVTDKHRRE